MKKSLCAISAVILLSLNTASPTYAEPTGTGLNYEVRLSGIETDLRAMNGKLEQMEFTVRRLDQAVQRMQTDMDARLTKLEFPPAPPQPIAAPPTTATPQPTTPAVIPPPATTPLVKPTPPAANNETNPNGTIGAIKMQGDKVTGATLNPQSTPLPDTPADYGLTPEEQYDRAFALLRQANYDEAEKAFKQFIDKNPKDKLIDNAKYWHGETLYVRGKFSEAAVAFADSYQHNAKGSKAPDSLLKLAMSLEGLDKKADACTTLGELKAKYPNASASLKSRAEEERAKLKCAK